MKITQRSQLKIYLSNKKIIIGISIISFFAFIGIFAPYLSPYDPQETRFPQAIPPSPKNLLGTNFIGQDVFTRLCYGARVSLVVGILAGILTTLIGTSIGIISGYEGGWIDTVLMRLTDIFLVIPSLALILFILAFIPEGGIFFVIIVIAFFSWPGMARVIRSQVLSLKNRPFIESAKALGASDIHIMTKELLPYLTPLITSYLSLSIASAIITEASLDFLGIGSPMTVSWGIMLSLAMSGNAFYYILWWWVLPPGLCIATLTFAFILLSQGINETVVR